MLSILYLLLKLYIQFVGKDQSRSDNFKIAKVTKVFKNGDKGDPENYRPMSISRPDYC